VKVDNSPIDTWLKEAIAQFGSDTTIQKLNLDKILVKINATKTALQDFAKRVKDWDFPPDWPSEKATYNKLLGQFSSACTDALRHKQAIANTRKESDKAGERAKIFWRGCRTRIRKHLEGGHRKVPGCVAKVFADMVYSSISPPGALMMDLGYNSPQCEVFPDTVSDVFKKPWLVKYCAEKTEDEMNYYEKALGDFFKEHKRLVGPKKYDAQKVMCHPKSAMQSTVCCIDIEDSKKLAFNAPWMTDKWFSNVEGLRCAIWVCFTECLNVSHQGWPFGGVPSFGTLFAGRAVCIMLDNEAVQENTNLMKWLPTLSSTELGKYPAWLMEEGDSVWIPCGSVPIFIGLSIDQKWEKDVKIKEDPPSGAIQRHTFAVGITPMFDSMSSRNMHGHEVCQHVASAWVRSSSWLPTTWKEAEGVQQWKVAMESPPEAANIAPSAGVGSL